MVMHLTAANVVLFYWLWRMPWASAQDLALVLQATADPDCHMTVNGINRVMKRHPEWVKGYRVGRKGNRVLRYTILPEGVVELERAFGWQPQWWHTAAGQILFFHRLPFVEASYRILPNLLQTKKSGMVAAYVPAICPDGNGGVAVVDYTVAVLQDLVWYQDSVVRLVAVYRVEGAPFDFYLPVVYYNSYRRPSDMESSWEDEVNQLLRGDIWQDSPDPGVDLLLERGCLPYPMLVVVPNEVVGVKARATEPWEKAFNLGILDLDQNIIAMFMGFPFRWKTVARNSRPASLGNRRDLEAVVTRSYWSALSGPLEWRFLCWAHDYQGSALEQFMLGCDIGERRAQQIRSRFEAQALVLVDGDGIYLGPNGYISYAAAEGVHINRVRGRQHAFLTNPSYREEHAEHCWEVAQLAVEAKSAGVPAYSGVHAVWHYPQYGTQIRPDVYFKVGVSPFASRGFMITDLTDEMYEILAADDTLAILVSGEVERRAGYVAPLEEKVKSYMTLYDNGVNVPMALVTRSEDVVKNFLRLARDLPVLATTWDKLAEQGFGACWGTSRHLSIIRPTDPRDPEYEQYVDFLNPVGLYAMHCNYRDWELLRALKYGWSENPRPDETEEPM